jgi:phospholipid/cholesterol/gamma-HCH transport system substrate-binding protein
VASYDPDTGKLTWGDQAPSSTGVAAPSSLGEESWKWLFLQPLTSGQE